MTTMFQHPDGHEIYFEHGELTSVTAEGTAVSIPLGSPANLLTLAAKLQEIANDEGNQAEQAGAEAAIDALGDMARTHDQGERIAALQSAILKTLDSPNPARFAAGVAVVLNGTFGLRGEE